MKSKSILTVLAVIALIIFAAGCSKTKPAVFTWSYQGFNYIADSAYSPASTVFNSLMVAYSGERVVGVNTKAKLAVGTYTLGTYSNGATPFIFYLDLNTLYSQSGTLNVTANDNTKMSGNFNTTFTDGSYMAGTFTDLPIR